MDKIKREYSYRTTDRELHVGKGAAERAKKHQRRIDFRATVKSLIPEAHKIFKIEDTYSTDDGETDEELLLLRVEECVGIDVSDFKDFVDYFVDLYMGIPEIVELLQLIDRKFKKFK